jgi:hypothetical protein
MALARIFATLGFLVGGIGLLFVVDYLDRPGGRSLESAFPAIAASVIGLFVCAFCIWQMHRGKKSGQGTGAPLTQLLFLIVFGLPALVIAGLSLYLILMVWLGPPPRIDGPPLQIPLIALPVCAIIFTVTLMEFIIAGRKSR